ncbi:hypothetical protein TRFO_23535 [Tritrichomonas foetus]|uniref:Uncharacterized protein n=1 Tax=Tritrichomonas foetus TaxID=1144522 RepID=A0A1J4KFD7_9EUKA|nr:hypothetical protein TRFO_23535 [Tritrichomonas foetus]|eukprot:OHT08085.1 hypothetical protein TRFO_23535 [Tritrichomonas foetus]
MNELHFGPNLKAPKEYHSIDWENGTMKKVEFFHNILTPVHVVIEDDPKLPSLLKEIDDNSTLAIDHQWSKPNDGENIELLLFCSSRGVLAIKKSHQENFNYSSQNLIEFIESHNFYAKNSREDAAKLSKFVGKKLNWKKYQIEDILRTRIMAYGYENISPQKMVKQFGNNLSPTAEFLDKCIVWSKWVNETLSIEQVLFAAYRILSFYNCIPLYNKPVYDFIPNDMNVAIPVEYIDGISKFNAVKKLKYLLVTNIEDFGEQGIRRIVGGKQSFSSIRVFGNKAVLEVSKVSEYKAPLENAGMKVGLFNVSDWYLPDNNADDDVDDL